MSDTEDEATAESPPSNPISPDLFAEAAAALGSTEDDEARGDAKDPEALLETASEKLAEVLDERESRGALESAIKADFGDHDVADALDARAGESDEDDERLTSALDRRVALKGPSAEIAETLREGLEASGDDEATDDDEAEGDDAPPKADKKLNAALDAFEGGPAKNELAAAIRDGLDVPEADEGSEADAEEEAAES